MTRVGLLVAVVVSVPLSLWLTYRLLANYHGFLFSGEAPPPAPHLSALAGDGDARLMWSVPGDQLPSVEHWEYQQRGSGGAIAGMHSTGSSATNYVVVGLTNWVTYSYRVRAALKQGGFGAWSNTVSVTPMREGELMERMERHVRAVAREQGRIADALSATATLMADHGEALGRFAGALETLAASSEKTTLEWIRIRNALDSLAAQGNKIVSALSCIEKRLAGQPAATTEAESFCGGGGDEPLAQIHFAHDSFCMMDIDESVDYEEEQQRVGQNKDSIGQVVKHLNQLGEPALVFTVGHATSVGVDRYNMHLSDMRAAYVSQCIRERVDRPNRFEFREVAKGEVLVAHDPPGARPESRRVDVIVCPMTEDDARETPGKLSDVIPDALTCGCPAAEGASTGGANE